MWIFINLNILSFLLLVMYVFRQRVYSMSPPWHRPTAAWNLFRTRRLSWQNRVKWFPPWSWAYSWNKPPTPPRNGLLQCASLWELSCFIYPPWERTFLTIVEKPQDTACSYWHSLSFVMVYWDLVKDCSNVSTLQVTNVVHPRLSKQCFLSTFMLYSCWCPWHILVVNGNMAWHQHE